MEAEGKLFVIRPTKTISIKRLEQDPEKLQEMYDLGVEDVQAKMEQLKEYLQN